MDEVGALRDIILRLKDNNDALRQCLLSVNRYLFGVRHQEARAMDEYIASSKLLEDLGITLHEDMDSLERSQYAKNN